MKWSNRWNHVGIRVKTMITQIVLIIIPFLLCFLLILRQISFNSQKENADVTYQYNRYVISGLDTAVRQLESMMIVADREHLLILSGTGEVIDPDEGIAAIGSGGNYALAAARALVQNTDLSAAEIAEKALHIAASICVYTNDHIVVETL